MNIINRGYYSRAALIFCARAMCGYYSRAATIRCAATIRINTVSLSLEIISYMRQHSKELSRRKLGSSQHDKFLNSWHCNNLVLTAECCPGVSGLSQLSHLRQWECQSLPRITLRSAASEVKRIQSEHWVNQCE